MSWSYYEWGTVLNGFFLLFCCALMLYVSYFKLEEMERHLQNCPLIVINKKVWSSFHPCDRAQRLMYISLVLGRIGFSHNTEELDMDEIKNFPAGLRRWALYPFRFGYFLFVMMGIHLIWGKWFLPT